MTTNTTSSFEELLERVRSCVPRLTKGKKAVLSALFLAEIPLTAHEIFACVCDDQNCTGSDDKHEHIDLATIYRNLEQFERLYLISKTEHSNGGWRYSLSEKHHSHSIVCVECGQKISMGMCVMAEVEKIIAERTGFVNIHHVVNFSGSCPTCQKPSSLPSM